MIVTTGSIALRKACLRSTAALVEALGSSGPDVVEAEDLEQARAGDARDDRQRDRAQGDGRQDEVPDRVDERVPLARDERG